jgi:hypothetical protein
MEHYEGTKSLDTQTPVVWRTEGAREQRHSDTQQLATLNNGALITRCPFNTITRSPSYAHRTLTPSPTTDSHAGSARGVRGKGREGGGRGRDLVAAADEQGAGGALPRVCVERARARESESESESESEREKEGDRERERGRGRGREGEK